MIYLILDISSNLFWIIIFLPVCWYKTTATYIHIFAIMEQVRDYFGVLGIEENVPFPSCRTEICHTGWWTLLYCCHQVHIQLLWNPGYFNSITHEPKNLLSFGCVLGNSCVKSHQDLSIWGPECVWAGFYLKDVSVLWAIYLLLSHDKPSGYCCLKTGFGSLVH